MATANMTAVGTYDLKVKAGCALNAKFTFDQQVASMVLRIKKGTEEPDLFTLSIGSGLILMAPNVVATSGVCLSRRDYYCFDAEIRYVNGFVFYLIGKIYFYDA